MEDLYKTVEAVKCASCGKLYEIDSKEFISFPGRICVGMVDPETIQSVHVSIYCKNRCFVELVARLRDKEEPVWRNGKATVRSSGDG